jgi:hypothetical protein
MSEMGDSTTSEGQLTCQGEEEKDTELSGGFIPVVKKRRPGEMTRKKKNTAQIVTTASRLPTAPTYTPKNKKIFAMFPGDFHKFATRNPSTPLRRRRKGAPTHTTKKTPGALNVVAMITSLMTAPSSKNTTYLNTVLTMLLLSSYVLCN